MFTTSINLEILILLAKFYYLSDESISENLLKNSVNNLYAKVKSETPIISRIECIDNCGIPKSTARIPVLAEILWLKNKYIFKKLKQN